MGIAFVVGALVPLLPYFFIENGRQGLMAALERLQSCCSSSVILKEARASRATMALGNSLPVIAMSAAAAVTSSDWRSHRWERSQASIIVHRYSSVSAFLRITTRCATFPGRRKPRTIAITSPRSSSCSNCCVPRNARRSSRLPMILLPCVIVSARRCDCGAS